MAVVAPWRKHPLCGLVWSCLVGKTRHTREEQSEVAAWVRLPSSFDHPSRSRPSSPSHGWM